MVTRHIYTIAYHRKKNTETPVKILILKQIYTETSEPSLEALSLILSSQNGHTEVTSLLLQNGAVINMQAEYGIEVIFDDAKSEWAHTNSFTTAAKWC